MEKYCIAKDMAKMIDHSLLNPIMTLDDITGGCKIALQYDVATVCVKPSELAHAASLLRGSSVLPATVIGFPHGSNKTSVKVFEAREAIADGARELDMVLNIGRLLSGDYEYVENDIKAVVDAAHAENVIVKVILENCYLTDDQKRDACAICERAGADFVKTSTGYGTGGATIEDIALMRGACSPNVRVKAAGGVRTYEKALEVRAAGAARFGATATKVIMDEAIERDKIRNSMPWRLVQNKIVRYPGGREIDKFRGVLPARDDGRPEAWVGSDTRTIAALRGGSTANGGTNSSNNNGTGSAANINTAAATIAATAAMVNATATITEDPNDGCAECILPDGTRLYLFEAIATDPLSVLGRRHININGPRLGYLVKLLDAERQLELQSHPTRTYAKEHFNSDFGKEESWYILSTRDDAPEPPYVYIGFKEGVTREVFEAAYDAQDADAIEGCCHKVIVEPGDAFFIRAGAPHAVGPGCFLLEVQEPSDITAGWHKLRSGTSDEQEAHKQRMLGCYIYDGAGEAENLSKYRIPPRIIRSGGWGYEELILGQGQTEYFSFTKLHTNSEVRLIRTGFPQIAVVTDGAGVLICGGTAMRLKRGDELFIPYAVGKIKIKPSTAQPGGKNTISIILCNPGQVYYNLMT